MSDQCPILSGTVLRDPYRRHLVTAISNRVDSAAESTYRYAHDLLDRATHRIDGGTVTNAFGYNPRSEVSSATFGTNAYTYAYDPIGNRLSATNNTAGVSYRTNPLNQYTNIANGVFLVPAYDLDGNMAASGDGWHYAWNGENRMVLASNDTMRVQYAYDHRGRMVWKTLGPADAPPTKTISYVWDDYNIVAETVVQDGATNTTYNIWGLDLSGTFQGAGGIGGLLAVVKDGEPFFPAFDANGNITEYVAADGTVVAHYGYSPFGEIIVQSGDMAGSFTHRFSTKPWCEVTGLIEYEFRPYSPKLGRWLSRDPTEEAGGLNLYGFCGNDGVNAIDVLGLEWIVNRNGVSQANADCKCDSIAELAEKIGLDVADYQKWLSPADGIPLPHSSTEIMASRRFRIPNTVYAYWAGDVGSAGKAWVNWNSSVSYLKSLGFATIAYDHQAGSSYVLQNVLQASAGSRALHGLYYWGHGWAPYPSCGLTTSDGADVVYYHDITFADGTGEIGIHLPYKMALALIYACDSNSGKPALFSGASGGVWHGYNGTLYPIIPFVYHVDSHIRHGNQETK